MNRNRALIATIVVAIMVIVLASLSLRIESGLRFVLFALAVVLVAASSAGLAVGFLHEARKRSRGKHAATREAATREAATRDIPTQLAARDAGRPEAGPPGSESSGDTSG